MSGAVRTCGCGHLPKFEGLASVCVVECVLPCTPSGVVGYMWGVRVTRGPRPAGGEKRRICAEIWNKVK